MSFSFRRPALLFLLQGHDPVVVPLANDAVVVRSTGINDRARTAPVAVLALGFAGGSPAHVDSVSLDKRLMGHYWLNMVIESIREFNRTVPFVPYEVRTSGGETYVVPHPDFIVVSPRGSFVIIVDKHDRPHHLNTILIERVSPLNGHARRKVRKRRA